MNTQAAPNIAVPSRGFTLVELMIAVAVVGILAATAIPYYNQYVQRTKRGEAQVALQDAAQFMQRFYAANNTYNVSLANNTPVALPASMQTLPSTGVGTQVYYTISLDPQALSATAYTLRAVPSNSMSSDKCGTLTLTQNGTRGLVNNTGGNTVATCWK